MNTSVQTEITQLRSADGQAVTLKSVHIEGRLAGLMLVMKTRQAYRNDGKSNLQTVYTFPLPWGARSCPGCSGRSCRPSRWSTWASD